MFNEKNNLLLSSHQSFITFGDGIIPLLCNRLISPASGGDTNKMDTSNDNTFPEPVEEIRLLIVELLGKAYKLTVLHTLITHCQVNQSSVIPSYPILSCMCMCVGLFVTTAVQSIVDLNGIIPTQLHPAHLLPALGAALGDPFPKVKLQSCDLIMHLCSVANSYQRDVRLHFRTTLLFKHLMLNITHQHFKVRAKSIATLSCCLNCLSEDVEVVLHDLVLPSLHKILNDRSPLPKIQLATLC